LLGSPEAIKRLPNAVHEPLLHAFSNALHTVFIWGAFLSALAFLLTLALKEVPLRTGAAPVAPEPQAAEPVATT
jgi:hypothetical protein